MITRHDNILIVLFPESEIEKGCADIFLPKKNQNTCHNTNKYIGLLWSIISKFYQKVQSHLV